MSTTNPYAVWKVNSFPFFISARALVTLAMQMESTAVGWQLYEKFGTAIAIAYVGLIQVLPVLLLSIPAGHLADNFDRRKIILFTQILFGLSAIGLALITHYQVSPIWIYVLVIVPGIVRAFAAPAISALMPNLVPQEHWGSAAKWNSSVFELTTMLGPALAGALIGITGGTTAVYITAAACAFACVLALSLIQIQIKAPSYVRRALTLHDLLGGLRFMWRTKLLLGAASLDLFSVFLGGATSLLPIIAKDILHVGPQGYGWLRAAPSIGALSMALVSTHLPPWKKSGRVLFGAFIGFGLATVVLGFSKNFWLSMAMLFLTGLFDNLNVVIRQTLVQFITPDNLRGRVSSINFIFIGCSNELGAFESGLTAQLFGTVPSIVGGGIGTLLVVLIIGLTVPRLRRLGPLDEIKPEGKEN